jgi:hypothetical protein
VEEYGGIEYGKLPVNCGRIHYHVVLHSNSMLGQFADNLTINDLYTAPEGFKSWHETGKAWAMMHPMKFEDPDGFRRTPVSAPLPRRGTDAGRRRSQWPRVEAQASLVASAPEPRPEFRQVVWPRRSPGGFQ